MSNKWCIGLDFGTDSVRAVLVDTNNGKTLCTHVHWYTRWKKGKFCSPQINRFRQHPLDHIEGMQETISEVVKQAGIKPEEVKGLCVDTTGSSPIPVDERGTPLALLPGFEDNPNAMMILWKDHTAISEADEINELARTWGGEDFTRYSGGIYSSEWFWAKILHTVRADENVREAAWSWMEHCDYMTWLLTAENELSRLKRSRCAAGHKAMWHESWGGLPDESFLSQLDPYLAQIRSRLYTETYTSDQPAGKLSAQWAEKLGLTDEVVVSVGTLDAHAGAVGAEVEEYTLVRVMGTSTCDMIVSPREVIADRTIRGICGQVDGSIIPNMIGLEAGQSAFGDVLAWFRDLLTWPVEHLLKKNTWLDPAQKQQLAEEIRSEMIGELSAQAENVPASASVPVALDWVNGRRTPDADQGLKAAIMDLALGTGAPHLFRALVEAICFGSKQIVDRFKEEGVEVRSVVGIGGVAEKSPFVMQTLANILNMPIKIAASEQAPALGSAMYAAVSAGIYPSMYEASKAMGNGFKTTYIPQAELVDIYQNRFDRYTKLGAFVESQVQ